MLIFPSSGTVSASAGTVSRPVKLYHSTAYRPAAKAALKGSAVSQAARSSTHCPGPPARTRSSSGRYAAAS